MPTYEVHHSIQLTQSQLDTLGDKITTLHATKFSTPRMFVNIHFINRTAEESSRKIYKGGKQATGNDIIANVRAGGSRSREDYVEHCREVEAAWNEVVGVEESKRGKEGYLRSVIVRGVILTGIEAGFARPLPGQDVQWLRENWESFNQLADGGDEEYKECVREVRERGLIGDT